MDSEPVLVVVVPRQRIPAVSIPLLCRNASGEEINMYGNFLDQKRRGSGDSREVSLNSLQYVFSEVFDLKPMSGVTDRRRF